jgi:hypothetical protein
MNFPSCPYCNRQIEYSVDYNINCYRNDDHAFWMNTQDKSWTITHYPSKLSIDNDAICDMSDVYEYTEILMEYDNISPEEGMIQLNKFLKLKAFL